MQHQTTPQEQPPATPPTFPAGRQQQLALAAANIKANMANHTGVQKTYSQYWRTYDNWHSERFSQPAPICPWTGLMWTDLETCSQFMGWMAHTKKTGSQVCSQQMSTTPPNHVPLLSHRPPVSLADEFCTQCFELAHHSSPCHS